MTQYARPDSDIANELWEDSESNYEDWFTMVNDDDDDTYISLSAEYGTDEEIIFGLSDVDTPDSGTRTITVRASDDSGMSAGSITVTLLEGGSSVQSVYPLSMAGTPTNTSFNITGSISDYSDLSISITGTDLTGMGVNINVYNVFFSVPDAAAAEAEDNSAFLLFVD